MGAMQSAECQRQPDVPQEAGRHRNGPLLGEAGGTGRNFLGTLIVNAEQVYLIFCIVQGMHRSNAGACPHLRVLDNKFKPSLK